MLHDPLLDALIQSAIAANLDLPTAETGIPEAGAQYRFISASGLPTVDAGASPTGSRSNERGNGSRD